MYLYVGGMPGTSIDVWRIHDEGAMAEPVQSVGSLLSPSFLCVHPGAAILYAVERKWSAQESATGALATYRIHAATGRLELLDRRPTAGAFTAHVSVCGNGRLLAVANPQGPNVAVFRLDDHGLPSGSPAVAVHHGRGATRRQNAPWPHCCQFDGSGARLYVSDLGLDRVFVYEVDQTVSALKPTSQSWLQVSAGAGARHLVLSADSQRVYVTNELDSTVSVFAASDEPGYLRILQTLESVPAAALNGNQPAEIAFGSGQHQLYVTNRGHDSIARFDVDAATGRLSLREHVPALGQSPRHISIAPDGRVAAVCNQRSNAVVLFRLLAEGAMVAQGVPLAVSNPTCAVFAQLGS